MKRKPVLENPLVLVAGFALLNVLMYLTIHKFWIGGSSFLPLVGQTGPNRGFVFSILVNAGVIVGALIGATTHREFRLRYPRGRDLWRSLVGGSLIGMGVTVCPGTCTTAFVTGMPMLAVSSFLSAAGIFVGAYVVFRMTTRRSVA